MAVRNVLKEEESDESERQLMALEKIARHLGEISHEMFQLRKLKTGPAVKKPTP